MTPQQIARRDRVAKATRIILTELNALGSDEEVKDGILDELTSSHNTLQQAFVRAIHGVLVDYADAQYDLRNAGAVEFANEVKDINVHFPLI